MKKLFLAMLLCLAVMNAKALGIKASNQILPTQQWGEFLEEPSPWYYGGVFGLNFIKDGYLFNVQPYLSYRASERIFLGISTGGSYVSQKVTVLNPLTVQEEKLKLNSIYVDNSFFGRWFCWGLKFIQLEPGYVSFQDISGWQWNPANQKFDILKQWKHVPYIQAGAGFVVPFGNNKYFMMRCMYDVLQREDSPYKGLPIIRGGVNIGT